MPLSKIPKDSREEELSVKSGETKIVKSGGEKIYIHFVLYDITN